MFVGQTEATERLNRAARIRRRAGVAHRPDDTLPTDDVQARRSRSGLTLARVGHWGTIRPPSRLICFSSHAVAVASRLRTPAFRAEEGPFV